MTANHEGPDGFDNLTIEAMNTTFYFSVSNCMISNWKEVVSGWVQYVEKEWSRFLPDNELGKVNRLEIGAKMLLTPPLFDVLQSAEVYRRKTNGLFSPYLLPQMQYHGYESSFPFHSSDPETYVMPSVYDQEICPFTFDLSTRTVTRTAEGKIDLGGIGKGYTVQATARWLKNIGEAESGIVDGGGDITVWSNGKKEWKIGISHPYQPNVEIARFRITNGSIATSNVVYRSWSQGNVIKHHLLNGKTGLPVETSIIQATVTTETCVDAEVMTKLCFMEEVEKIPDMLKNFDLNSSFLLITEKGTVIRS
ncbi:FAD:protein FMN transferase [Neobacillus sp.]|uniref:FAD:protein FMN transferase n=1 Tax=Neobacillus sp. TaxID=2675273 RepID=UPI0028A25F57|nr:FAD:protein FMN transferase [Neobacillus sp.]